MIVLWSSDQVKVESKVVLSIELIVRE